MLIFREHEVFASYFTKLIARLVETGYPFSKLMICLSGQHEMVTDFSGFRNFFTLNFIAKPIYNAHLMTSRLCDYLVSAEGKSENLFVIPTTDAEGSYALMVTYCEPLFGEDLPPVTEEVTFSEDISDREVEIYCIDKTHTNPYRTWERAGMPAVTGELLRALRKEGELAPMQVQGGAEPIRISLTANATYLITVKRKETGK